MKCRYPECKKNLEGEFEEILKQGYGWCERGHRTVLPGDTKNDWNCECGARKTNQPGHDWYCPHFKKESK